jgi:SEC-C motif-containing protein
LVKSRIIAAMPTRTTTSGACPCGGPSLATCCGPYLAGAAVPATAEALMRSRYTAYAQKNEDYLLATWHPGTRPAEPIIDQNEKIQWLGLEVKSSLRLRQRKAEMPTPPDSDTVEFVARFKIGGRAHRLHEVSRFVYELGADGVARWFYLDGGYPE